MSKQQPAKSGPQEAIRQMPHNDDAERCVLAAALEDNKTIGLIDSYLTPECFYRESHRLIWRAIKAIHGRGFEVDLLTLTDELSARGELEVAGLFTAPTSLLSYGVSARAVEYWLRLVAEDAAQRRAIPELEALVEKLYTSAVRGEEIPAALADLSAKATPRGPQGVGKEGADLIEEWNRWVGESCVGGGAALSTGIAEMDALIDGGFRSGRSYYVGGLSKMGKTTWAVNAAAAALREGYAVFFLSVEMARVELLNRILANLSGVNMGRYLGAVKNQYDLARGQMSHPLTNRENNDLLEHLPRWHEKIDQCRDLLKSSPLRLEQQGAPSARDFYLAVQAWRLQLEARGHDPKKMLVVADYLQSFRSGNPKLDSDEVSRISAVSQRLNAISKDFDCPIIIPFQFGRSAEQAFTTGGKMPTFADARGSSQIANDANHLLVYHRPKWRDEGREGRFVTIRSELSRTQQGTPEAHFEVDGARQRYLAWTGDLPVAEAEERPGRRSPEREIKRW